MSKNLRLGAASIAFSQPLYIESAASIVSQKEADGPLGDLFDLVCEDPMFGCDTWESAESTLQFPLPDSPTQWLHPPLSSGQKDMFSA